MNILASVGLVVALTVNRATFAATRHTWRVADSVCGVDRMTRDGHRLPDLVPEKAFSHVLKVVLR
jgi:hypothetical protein